jgi:hypothetical protein
MADVYLRRAQLRPVLEPIDDAGLETVRSLPASAVVKAKLTRPRALPHLRWYWALCTLVAENSEGRTAEDVSTLLKLATGHRDEYPIKPAPCPHCGKDVDRVAYVPKSISFAKMDETTFKKFTDDCVRVVVQRIMPGMDSDILRAEIEAMLS